MVLGTPLKNNFRHSFAGSVEKISLKKFMRLERKNKNFNVLYKDGGEEAGKMTAANHGRS